MVRILLFVLLSTISFLQIAVACTLPTPSISTSGQLTFCQGNSVTLTSSTGTGYSYQWKKNGTNISGATSSSYIATQTGSYTVQVTLDTCVSTSLPADVTVNPNPNATLNGVGTICSGETVQLVAGGGTSYNWSAAGANGNTVMVSPTSTTTYYVTVTNSYGCNTVMSLQITVKPLPQATISVAGSPVLCSGESVNLNASTGTGYNYQWKKNNSNISGATNSTLNVNSAGDYKVVVTLNGCSKTSSIQTIVVNPLPTPQVTADTTICAEVTVNLHASGGTSYQWSGGGPASADYPVSPTTTKTYTVTVTNSYGCSQTASTTITVIPLPQVWVSAAGSTTLCQGQSVNLNTANTAGYTYQWYRNGTPISGATTNVYAASQAGQYFTRNTASGCSDTSSEVSIIVNPLPITTISNDTTICSGDTVTLTATGGINYSWNTGFSGAVYTVSTTSTRTYSVTISDANNCSVLKSATVTTIALPSASVSLSGPSTFCANSSLTMTASAGAGYAYQWLKDNSPINGGTNQAYVATQTGSYVVSVTANGCLKKSTPVNAVVNPLPVSNASNDTTICAEDTIQLWASGGTSYQWYNGNTNPTISIFPTSTTTYTVTVSNNFNCTVSESILVTVIPLPQAWISASGSTVLCQGETRNLNTANSGSYSYQWFKNGNPIAGATTSVYGASQAGQYYVQNTANGCTDTSATISIAVNPLPVTTISNDTTICSGDTVTLIATGGSSYQWNTGFSGPVYTVSTTSTRTYSVTISDVTTCAVVRNVVVTVIPLPNASVSLNGSSTQCADRTLTMTASSGAGYSYQWTKDNIQLSGATNQAYVATQSGNYFVDVTANGCTKRSITTNVTVNPLPVASASNDTTICSGDTIQLYAAGGTSYSWYNGNTNSTIQVSPNSNTTYGVTVSNTYGCTVAESIVVSTIARPNSNVNPAGTISICQGESATLNASTGTGYSYQWKNGAATLNGETNSSLTVNSAGNYHVIVTADGCPKKSNSTQVIVNPKPIVTVNNDTTICSGNPVLLTANGGAAYKWSTGANNQSITVSPATTTNYIVTVTSSYGCTATGDVFISVIPSPGAVVTTSGSLNICEGDTVTLSANTGPAYSFQWRENGVDITGEITSVYKATTTGTYSVMVTAFGCARTSSPFPVVVNSLPTAVVSNDTLVCQGSEVILSASGGTTYQWSNGRVSADISVIPNSTTTYLLTVTDANGCKDYNEVTVNVNPLPNAYLSTSGSTNLCNGQTVTLNASTGVGYTYVWFKDSVIIAGADSSKYFAGQTGTYWVVVSLNGCSKISSSVSVTVNPVLIATVSPDVTICSGDSTTLTATGGGDYLWSTGETTASIKVAPTNTKTYSVTVSSGISCSAIKSVVVNVKPLPNSFISVAGGSTDICVGQTVALNANLGTGLSYRWKRNSNQISGATSSQYIASDSGSYTVVVTQNGCSKESTPKDVVIRPLPIVTVSDDTTVCAQSSIKLFVSGGVSYVWSTFSTDSALNVSPTSSRTYAVTVTNSFGCKSTDSVRVDVLPLPSNVNITTSTSTNICDGKSVMLNSTNTDGISFQWLLDQANIPGATSSSYNASEGGAYSIVVTGSNGCKKTSSAQTVTVNPTPEQPTITRVGLDSLRCSEEGSNYKWFRDGLTYNVGSRQIKATKDGSYTVYVTSDKNCSSDTSAPYYFSLTGINSIAENPISIYPNPNSGRFKIGLPDELTGQKVNVRIYNALGAIVWKQHYSGAKGNIPVSIDSLKPGIYMIEIAAANSKSVSKIVIDY